MDIEHLMYKPRAIEHLSVQLNRGTISLFLGAGISKGIGLPDWPELIESLNIEYHKSTNKKFDINTYQPLVSVDSTAIELQEIADDIITRVNNIEKFHDILQKALYPENISFNADSNFFNQKLLSAIGALMIGSKRGRVKNVITFNFDNILEWYLNIFGYIAKIIYKLPKLEGDEDVRIYHPHGFIPHPDMNLKRSDFSILGLNSVSKRLGEQGDPWFEKTRHLMRASTCLFVGMSERTFKDMAIAPLINTVGQEVRAERPLGFWIIYGKLKDNQRNNFLKNNVVPIELNTENEITDFIFSICQESAKKIQLNIL